MIYFFVLIFFFLYSFTLFLIGNLYLLCLIFLFNFIISFILGVPFKKHLKAFINNIMFILFIIICNLLFSDIASSLKVGIRLFLAIDYTYIMSYYFNPTKIRTAFRYLLYPLKLFKIDIDSLTLVIAISLSFIPILIEEVRMIKLSLQSKGFDFSIGNLITKPHIYFITFLNSLFDKVDELEKTLVIKAY